MATLDCSCDKWQCREEECNYMRSYAAVESIPSEVLSMKIVSRVANRRDECTMVPFSR